MKRKHWRNHAIVTAGVFCITLASYVADQHHLYWANLVVSLIWIWGSGDD